MVATTKRPGSRPGRFVFQAICSALRIVKIGSTGIDCKLRGGIALPELSRTYRAAAFHVRAENFRGPLRVPEMIDRGVNVVRQIPLGLTQILDLRSFAFQAGFE